MKIVQKRWHFPSKPNSQFSFFKILLDYLWVSSNKLLWSDFLPLERDFSFPLGNMLKLKLTFCAPFPLPWMCSYKSLNSRLFYHFDQINGIESSSTGNSIYSISSWKTVVIHFFPQFKQPEVASVFSSYTRNVWILKMNKYTKRYSIVKTFKIKWITAQTQVEEDTNIKSISYSLNFFIKAKLIMEFKLFGSRPRFFISCFWLT